MSKPRMVGAFGKYTPNNKMDERYNHRGFVREKPFAKGVVCNDRTGVNVTNLHSSTDRQDK